MTKNTTPLGTGQQSTNESYFRDKSVERVKQTAKYCPLDTVEMDSIRGRDLEK